MGKQKVNWDALNGMTEQQAEDFMIKNWGRIPEKWNDPLFRQEITGQPADIEAHMNFGEQAYGGGSRLGKDAKPTWWKRNIEGQGHPGEKTYVKSQQQNPLGEKKG